MNTRAIRPAIAFTSIQVAFGILALILVLVLGCPESDPLLPCSESETGECEDLIKFDVLEIPDAPCTPLPEPPQ